MNISISSRSSSSNSAIVIFLKQRKIIQLYCFRITAVAHSFKNSAVARNQIKMLAPSSSKALFLEICVAT
jgi:hypothetical protein